MGNLADSLQELRQLHVARSYTPDSLSKASRKELCLFLDVYSKAIVAVAYLRVTDKEGISNVSFVLGKTSLYLNLPYLHWQSSYLMRLT